MSKKKAVKTVKQKKISFNFEAPEAQDVSVVGNFNEWNKAKHPMKNDGNGIWIKSVMLTPGTYEYKFLVDNKWEHDPKNEKLVPNTFGTLNNIIEIG